MDENMQELCDQMGVDFHDLYAKLTTAQRYADTNRVGWAIVLTPMEYHVVTTAMEIAGGL